MKKHRRPEECRKESHDALLDDLEIMKWEYLLLRIELPVIAIFSAKEAENIRIADSTREAQELIMTFNKLGDQGWEAVIHNSLENSLLFKRQKN